MGLVDSLFRRGDCRVRVFILLAGLLVAVTGVTPFDLTGVDIGADHVGELTLTIVVLIGTYFALD